MMGHERDNSLHVLPDHTLQCDSTDIMPAALVLVQAVGGADKEVLPLFKGAGGGVVQLLPAIGTIDQAREDTALACCRSAMPLLTDLLHLVIDLLGDDGGVCTIENLLILYGVCPMLLVPNRI